MPKKPKLEGDETPPEVLEAAPDEASDSLSEFLNDLPAEDLYIVLFRKGADKKMYRIGRFLPDELKIDDIPARYGGGDYRLFVRQKGRYLKSLEVSFDPRLKGELDQPSSPGNATTPDFSLIAQIREDMRNQQALFMNVLEKLAGNRPDPLEQIKTLAEIKGLFGTDRVKVSEIMEALKMGREMAADVDAGASVSDKIMNTIANMLLKNAAPPAGPPAGRMQVLNPGRPAAQNPQEQEPPMNEKTIIAKKISAFVPILLTAAQNGSDAAIYADMIADQVPPGAEKSVSEFLSGGAWFDRLAAQVPACVEHREWFLTVSRLVLESLTPEPRQEQAGG
jgi:hypothetical protein